MNLPILATAILLTLALFAHFCVGTRETAGLRPAENDSNKNRIQALCVFQLVSIDLLLLAVLSFLLALTDLLPDKRTIAYSIAAWLALWGVAWLWQLKAARADGKTFLLLGQWILFFGCAGLMLWGAQSV